MTSGRPAGAGVPAGPAGAVPDEFASAATEPAATDPTAAAASAADEVQRWRRLAEERGGQVERLAEEVRRLRAVAANQQGAAGQPASSPRVQVPEATARVVMWLVTLSAVAVLGKVLGYDDDALSAFWFITVIAVVTIAMVFLTRRR